MEWQATSTEHDAGITGVVIMFATVYNSISIADQHRQHSLRDIIRTAASTEYGDWRRSCRG